MEQAAGVRYLRSGNDASRTVAGSPVLIRYADDLVALCHSRNEAEQVKARLGDWLAPRGLVFNEDKTRIVTLDEGFDFLGFNVRRYRGKLLIKPSDAALRRVRERLGTEMRSLRGANASAVIRRLNPIIKGWAGYYRGVVSSEAFRALDGHVWRLTYKWAVFTHSKQPKRWVIARHYGMFNKSRQDRWVFADRASGAYLHKFAWTKIIRHQMVPGTASPDDAALTEYWAARRRKTPPPPIGKANLRLFEQQDRRCPLCGDWLLAVENPPQNPHEWAHWLAVTHKATLKVAMLRSGTSQMIKPRLIHAHCYHRHHISDGAQPGPSAQPRDPKGACPSRMR